MGSDIAIDCLAAKMGIDPFEMRAMNCYKEKDDSRTPTGCRPDILRGRALRRRVPTIGQPLRECARRTRPPTAELNTASVSRWVFTAGLGNTDASVHIELNPDDTVTLINSWEDHGQGADIATLTSAHGVLCERFHPTESG